MRPPDADVRERIVAARGVNLSVEAGAGTGKTTLLIARLLSLLEDGARLKRLAVITFTRKAAAELSARLRRRLAEARRDGHAWAAEALAELDAASIGTTDSFCRAILADFPLEARLAPGFSLVDEVAQDALLDLAWDRCLAAAGPREQRLFEDLRQAGADPAALRALGAELIDQRDLSLAEIPAVDPPDIVALFRERLAPALAAARACRDPEDLLLQRVRELERDAAAAGSLSGTAAERIVLRGKRNKGRYATSRGKAASWGGKGNKDAVVAALTRLDEAMDDALRARGARLAADTGAWLLAFAAEYERTKRERGLVDFRDLALETRRLLAIASVRRRLSARWDAILLDEVQDTDPLQMEIAFLLAAAEPDLDDAVASPLRDGALFLVGDPKQSIYRFRRADIELYERARSRLAADGEAHVVRANFRSHPSILAFVNRVFDGWMEPSEGTSWQARYEALLPGRPPADGDDEVRAALVLPDPAAERELLARAGSDTLRAAEREELELDAVVRLVRSGLGLDGGGDGDDGDGAWTVRDAESGAMRPARPRDVAVLVRKIRWGDALADALRRAGVPAAVSGGKRFHQREEVQTLAALLDMVAHPQRRLARFAALRGPAFALSDDELVRRFDPGDRPAASSPRLAEAEATLDRLSALARELPVPEFLERLCEETALLATFGTRPDGPGRIESLRLLVEAADSLGGAGLDTLPAYAQWLRQQEGESGRALFGELVPEGADAVEVLTMHKAKGLEFPVVVLADLAGMAGNRSHVVCDRTRGRIEFRIPGAPEASTPGFEEAAEREKERTEAEEVRLLYVAVTRARDRLFLSWPAAKAGFLAALPGRLGGAAGAAIDSDVVRTVRAADFPPLAEAARLHAVDVDAAVARARAHAPELPFGVPDDRRTATAEPAAALRITPATVLAGGDAAPRADAAGEPAAAPRFPEWDARRFGTFLHAVLEIADLADPHGLAAARDDALARLGAEWRVTDDGAVRLDAELRRLDADPVLGALREEAIAAGARAQREVPFLLPRGDGFVSGTIDLLLEHDDGSLTLVDYKSGGAGERARAQAAVYAEAAARLTGRVVREVRLVLLGTEPVSVRTLAGKELMAEGRILVGE